jgi:NAD(P) transhydrogenase subunit alpha
VAGGLCARRAWIADALTQRYGALAVSRAASVRGRPANLPDGFGPELAAASRAYAAAAGAPARAARSFQEACALSFIAIFSIFVLACFVGYFVVWGVTPALHTPLMAVTNAISSVIIVGALIAAAEAGSPAAKWLGLLGVVLASINIFGGFAVTERMLAMYKKKERR